MDAPQRGDWLEDVLGRFDPRWLLTWDGLAEDRAARSGIRRISTGDVADWVGELLAIYQRERGKLLGVARRRLGSFSQDAEDVLQEVMRKLCERPVALRDPAKLTSYVYTAVHNETSTWGRRAAAERSRREPDDDGAAAVPDPAPQFDDAVVFHLVMTRALAALSPREREMIQLVDIGRLTEREAAAKLGITIGTAKNYRHSARMRLREDPALAKLRDAA